MFVDLATRTVAGELDIGRGPMGIAITRDGTRAFVGLFGETYIAEVDIAARTFMPIPTGESFNEEIAIDDSGEVGLLTSGAAGNVRSFSVAEPGTVFGRTASLDGDSAGTAFFPGTKIAYLVQAPPPLTLFVGGHDLIDVSEPRAPVATDHIRSSANAPVTYPVTAVKARNSVAYPANRAGRQFVVEVKLEGDTAQEVQTIEVGEGGCSATALERHHMFAFLMTEGSVPEDKIDAGWVDCGSFFEGRAGSLGGAETPIVQYPPHGVTAPENEGLGRTLGRRSLLRLEMHSFNFTDKPVLREAWLNVYYRPRGRDPAVGL